MEALTVTRQGGGGLFSGVGCKSLTSETGKILQGAKWLGIALVCAGMASCSSTSNTVVAKKEKPKSKEYFAESEYGVKASPRVVADGKPVPKGGGRFMVGTPYEVKGKTYVPKEDPNYNKSGLASWYGAAFHGRMTANGEVYDLDHISAAHPTFPLPSYARVTNTVTGSSVIVRVNDRGPFHAGRIIDVSSKAAELLDFKRTGTAKVNVQYVGRARMDGHDMPFLMASYVRKGDRIPGIRPEGEIATGVMVASNQSLGDQLQSYGAGAPTAFAGSTPSGKPEKPSAPAAFNSAAAPLPSVRPTNLSAAPAERPAAPRQAQAPVAAYQVASAPVAKPAPMQVQAPKPASRAPAALPVEARMAPPVQARPKAQPVQQARPAASTQTAYAAPAPSAAAPRVVFGNVVLRDDGLIQQVPGSAPQKTPKR